MDDLKLRAEYKRQAQIALDIQDACNSSGIVYSFVDAMNVLSNYCSYYGYGTEWKNNHPIVTLYLSKLASLNGNFLHYQQKESDAFLECKAIARS